MKKELMVRSSSCDLALAKLRDELSQYRRKYRVKTWRWLHKPEALEYRGQWRAYGRIEFEK